MAFKTYEIMLKARGISAASDDPSLAASASSATFTIDSMIVNGIDKPASKFSATELATLTAALKAGIVDVLDVNTIGAATITKGAGVNSGVGQFTVTGVSCAPGTVAETWTVTVTNATAPATWSVVGGTSGAKASATTGVAYDNGQIAFTINDTGTDAAVADQFTLVVSQV